MDLAQGHLVALNYLREKKPGVKAWNLGTGKGSTVFDMVKAFSHAVGRDLPYQVVPRRDGDVLDLTANPTLAKTELGWKAQRTLEEACEDLWRWTKNNPEGYRQQPPQEFLDATVPRQKFQSRTRFSCVTAPNPISFSIMPTTEPIYAAPVAPSF